LLAQLTQTTTQLVQQLQTLNETTERRLNHMRENIETRLSSIEAKNSEKLEQMRVTVDEKLHATLEQRLGESFKQVSERLEQVHRGLGEMQTLAVGVGDLQRVLTNVKTRGNWGEMQLASLLENVFTPDRYAANVKVKPNSNEMVDFAIKLPGRSDNADEVVWLPVDAKFPKEQYERMQNAQDAADADAFDVARKELFTQIKLEAKSISDKYISPPHTTDFAVMFLPTEGLYAEVAREAGLLDLLQREHRIVVSGPTTLTALLNSLHMGFRTLAMEKRASEVWRVLGAVKTEFGKFGDVLAKTKNKLESAAKEIDSAQVRTRAMSRALSGVEQIEGDTAAQLLGLGEDETKLINDGAQDTLL
jgi:DNA recombination protein RmuC